MPLAIFCGYIALFVLDLVRNPEDRFSHNKARIVQDRDFLVDTARTATQSCAFMNPSMQNLGQRLWKRSGILETIVIPLQGNASIVNVSNVHLRSMFTYRKELSFTPEKKSLGKRFLSDPGCLTLGVTSCSTRVTLRPSFHIFQLQVR